MKSIVIALTGLMAAMGGSFVYAAADASAAGNAPVAVAASSQTAAFFAKPVFLRGTLGDANIQFNIRPKEVADEGLEGEYFVFGNSGKVLIAGEVEGDALLLEESENGKDISGQWDARLQGDTLSGTWTSADGSFTKPFVLKVIAMKDNTAAATPRGKKVATDTRK